MDRKTCFHEYETITNETLTNAIKENPKLQNYFTSSFGDIKATHCCGILHVKGEDYYILPKIAKDDTHNLDTFIYMLAHAYDITDKSIALIDIVLRRCFSFLKIKPESAWVQRQKQKSFSIRF